MAMLKTRGLGGGASQTQKYIPAVNIGNAVSLTCLHAPVPCAEVSYWCLHVLTDTSEDGVRMAATLLTPDSSRVYG